MPFDFFRRMVGVEKNKIDFSEEQELKNKFTVSGAHNPFYEQFKLAGIHDQENPERKEVAIDLLKTLKEDARSYRIHGLEHWAQALEKHQEHLANLTAEQRKNIEKEIVDGAIPIWMPGKKVLLATTLESFTVAARPVYIVGNGLGYRQKPVQDAYLEWEHFKQLIANHDSRLVLEIPEQPYLSLQRPTPNPDPRTCNKTISEQHLEVLKINKERGQQFLPLHSITIYEYLALQLRATERAAGIAQKTRLDHLQPLDSKTFTRFIDLPTEDGSVPSANYSPDVGVVGFDRNSSDHRYSWSGFRFVVRINI